MGKILATAALGISGFGMTSQTEAGQLFSGQFGAEGTWNVYEALNSGLTFEEAWYYALNAPNPTGAAVPGYLVSMGSAAENAFVNTNAGGDRWIGLTDRFGLVAGATESNVTADKLTMGWAWASGEPFTYQNWGGGEPNDAGNETGGGEDAGQMVGSGTWNDNGSGFNTNEPVVDPSGKSGDEGQPVFNFVIEWPTNLATQPTLPPSRPNPAALRRVFPTPLARLPGPNGTASAFGVREVRDAGGVEDSRDGVARIAAGTGRIVNGSTARIDLADPMTNGGGTGVVTGGEVPFISNVTGVEDNDVQTVIKGTFRVPAGQGGLYTFNGHSDDGFAMRILSQATPSSPVVQHRFLESRGGFVDQDGSLTFLYPTGDSNTQGLIDLQPGTYDVEFTAWENGGGAYWELSTAKGDFVNTAPNTTPQYILLGDSSTKPQVGFAQPVRMTGMATVNNWLGATFDIPSAILTSRSGATPDATGSFNEVILADGLTPGDICCGRPGANLPASQVNRFPVVTNPDFNDFSTMVSGQFTVLNTDGQPGELLTFTLQSDDGSALRIVGQDFTGVSDFSGDGDAVLVDGATIFDFEGAGDTYLYFEGATGNANTFGTITLAEGTYSFEAWQRQGGGDSGLEIWAAAGDYLATGFNPAAFFPLSSETLAGNISIANTGLGLVAGPGTGPAAKPGDFDGDGDVDGRDLLVWQRGGSPTPMSAADLTAWKTNFGTAVAAADAVPEPGSLALALAALGLVAGVRRR